MIGGSARRWLAAGCVLGLVALAGGTHGLATLRRGWSEERERRSEAFGDVPGPERRGPESLERLFEALPSPGDDTTGVRVLEDNGEAWLARWRLLAEAERSIDVAVFILSADEHGRAFLAHLLERARDGVRVRLVLDALGTDLGRDLLESDLLDALAREPTVSVHFFRPLTHRWMEALLSANPTLVLASDHDKMLIVDGRRSIVGGRNISAHYFEDPARSEQAFRDADVLLEGRSVARRLTETFERKVEDAEAFEPERIDLVPADAELERAYAAMQARLSEALEREPTGTLHRARVRIVDSTARGGDAGDAVSRTLASLVRATGSSLDIRTPYVVLPEQSVALLEESGAAGVRTRMLTNSPRSSDNATSQAFFLEQWREIVTRVDRLELYGAGDTRTMHAKVGVFDGVLSVVGTYNLDPLSVAVNGEVAAVIWSESVARELTEGLQSTLDQGPPRVYRYDDELGPADHTDPTEWTSLRLQWALVRLLVRLGFDPIW